jgi:hypothetical protein
MTRDTALRRFLAGLKQPMGFHADGRVLGAGTAAALRAQRDDRPPVTEFAESPADRERLHR